ncbi:Blp family class II bacteriocin [Clostridium sp.]|uniref:Blp family class II bacteriocin n=1 Tax=Clostridium sp. TaxID=1506 RepID=UPI0032169F14
MQQVKELSVQDLQQINGGASVCNWGVGLSGVALSAIYGAAWRGPAGMIAGAVVGTDWIPVGTACQ